MVLIKLLLWPRGRFVFDVVMELVNVYITPVVLVIIRTDSYHVSSKVTCSHSVFITERVEVLSVYAIEEMLPFRSVLPVCITLFEPGNRPDVQGF